jgi:hypothetical protein
MTTQNATDEEARRSEITRAPLAVIATWISVFAFGAVFWGFVLHAAPGVARHVYRSVRSEELHAGIHPLRLFKRFTAENPSGDRYS